MTTPSAPAPDRSDSGDSDTLPWILMIEDDAGLVQSVRELFAPYRLRIEAAKTAAAALPLLLIAEPSRRPGAVILDSMLPYEDGKNRLEGEGALGLKLAKESDPYESDTGLHLLNELRAHEEKNGLAPVWVAVTTARSAPELLDRVRASLVASNQRATGKIYAKPFDDMRLEFELCTVLQIECKLDPIFVSALEEEAHGGS